MDGKRATNQALQLGWQGTQRPTDAATPTNPPKLAFIGIGRTGSSTATRLRALGITLDRSIVIDSADTHLSNTSTHQQTLANINSITQSSDTLLITLQASDTRFQDQLEHALTHVETVFLATAIDCDIDTKIASLVTKVARKNGAIIVGAVTTSPAVEQRTKAQVTQILAQLQHDCDMVVAVDNTSITELAPQISRDEARNLSSQALATVLIHLVETISKQSLNNPDSQSIRTIVENGGLAAMSIGESDSSNRLEEAVHNALKGLNKHPFMEIDCMRARGAVLQVIGGSGLTDEEIMHAREIVQELLQKETQVVWGARVRPEFEGRIRVILMMTGLTPRAIKGTLSSLTPNLFDLEPEAKPEQSLAIELELYQLESF
jgi:cell division protein FtsZ